MPKLNCRHLLHGNFAKADDNKVILRTEDISLVSLSHSVRIKMWFRKCFCHQTKNHGVSRRTPPLSYSVYNWRVVKTHWEYLKKIINIIPVTQSTTASSFSPDFQTSQSMYVLTDTDDSLVPSGQLHPQLNTFLQSREIIPVRYPMYSKLTRRGQRKDKASSHTDSETSKQAEKWNSSRRCACPPHLLRNP